MLAFQFMAAEVIYARVPKTLKEAADAFASERGKTLTGAVIELLECGLMAISNERSIVELEKNLAEVSAEKSRVVADLHAADAEVNALRTFGQRAARPIGTCPNSLCSKSISGYDLLALGQCPHCGQTLSSLIAPKAEAPTIDQREIMILIGALGAVLGIAYLASK